MMDVRKVPLRLENCLVISHFSKLLKGKSFHVNSGNNVGNFYRSYINVNISLGHLGKKLKKTYCISKSLIIFAITRLNLKICS